MENKQASPRGPRFQYEVEGLRRGFGHPFVRIMVPIALTTHRAERFVIKTLNSVRPTLPEDLQTDLARLVREESIHIREFQRLSDASTKALDTHATRSKLDAASERFLARYRTWPTRIRVAIAAAYEFVAGAYLRAFEAHWSAMLTHASEREIELVRQTGIVDIFEWHAAEEHGHRSVAFDVLRAHDIGYGLRIFGILCVSFDLLRYAVPALVALGSRADFLSVVTPRIRSRSYGQRVIARMCAYFVPGFHPDTIPDERRHENHRKPTEAV